MSDQGELYEKSWILYHILTRKIGSRENVAALRTLTVSEDQLTRCTENRSCKCETITTGSWAEGMRIEESHVDLMFIDRSVIVKCPDKDISSQLNSANNSVLMMREAGCRPGYVNLELLHLGKNIHPRVLQSIVPVGNVNFLSSEIYRQAVCCLVNEDPNTAIHGPAVTVKGLQYKNFADVDKVSSFPCYNWPSEANEWVSRPRLHNWPDKGLRDQIIHGGCLLVPVGDQTSADPFLQWRISFATAERKLIYSLTHVQFLVYGLLKYFLKQMSGTLEQILGEADILSSYIVKTVIFHAVESTTESFWQEKHTFLCFMFCLKILINWVNAGHCPNYFIKKNNMFLGKVHGRIQRELLRFLTYLHDMKWGCLSVGTFIQGELIHSARKGAWNYVLPPSTHSESYRDLYVFGRAFSSRVSAGALPLSLELLSGSKSDIDEFIGYFATVQALSQTGMKTFSEHISPRGNKEKYKSLRKCKNLLKPFETVSTNPGLLTFYYQTGNYMKTLEMCSHIISSFKMYPDMSGSQNSDRYERLYCGRGYNLLQKCQAFVSDIIITKDAPQFCPSELHPEITKAKEGDSIRIPPLPYAVFLSFLCYRKLGNTRRRDASLIYLKYLKTDDVQGCSKHWIVHILLGMCFEMVGDTRGALREYTESLTRQGIDKHHNAAKERIARLQH